MTTEPLRIELTNGETLAKNGLSIYHREIQVSEHIHLALFEATHNKTVTLINRFENLKPHCYYILYAGYGHGNKRQT